ncbi:hypothetical protein [Roseixanthobacter glucoisosaccharinicivorans]|uniref:hypothetical protein n=1 Tax=Roseixanthobacter glucoisosaccharinicivorans TaxID=3119923 RepID=UPI0037286498
MRLEGYVLSALMVAASATIFGDLSRAAAPEQADIQAQIPPAASAAALTPPAGLAGDDPCGTSRATALRFLDQGAYASDATSACALR